MPNKTAPDDKRNRKRLLIEAELMLEAHEYAIRNGFMLANGDVHDGISAVLAHIVKGGKK